MLCVHGCMALEIVHAHARGMHTRSVAHNGGAPSPLAPSLIPIRSPLSSRARPCVRVRARACVRVRARACACVPMRARACACVRVCSQWLADAEPDPHNVHFQTIVRACDEYAALPEVTSSYGERARHIYVWVE